MSQVDEIRKAVTSRFREVYESSVANGLEPQSEPSYSVFVQSSLLIALPLLIETYDAFLAADSSDLANRVRDFLMPFREHLRKEVPTTRSNQSQA